jgi:hypothetical protein|tara:strand:+ start:528 stop:1013 length:486 start_codon:yes stop_codon:yes gene_type:complete
MKKIKVSFDTWIQLLGMIGVLGGLVFVGLEMQQSQRIAIAGQIQARNDVLMSFLATPLEGNATLSKVVNTYWEQDGPLDLTQASNEEREVAMQMVRIGVFNLRNTYQQYNLGMIPPATFKRTMQNLSNFYDTCPFRKMVIANVSLDLHEFLKSNSRVECME